jgi:hypothetical protein
VFPFPTKVLTVVKDVSDSWKEYCTSIFPHPYWRPKKLSITTRLLNWFCCSFQCPQYRILLNVDCLSHPNSRRPIYISSSDHFTTSAENADMIQ